MIAWLLLNAAFALPALNSPHRAGAGAPNDAAVVVGVEDYAFIADVPYAGADARLVYDTLLYTVGIPQHKIQLLQGGSREQILQRVEDAAAMVGPGGRLWFYFAGHGAASLHSGERMLLGDDVKADSSVFDARGVRLSELTALAHEKESLWLLDTCFAGQGRGGEALLPGTRFAVPTQATRIPAQTTEFTSVEMECSSEGRFCGSADVRAKGQGEESLASCAEVCMTFFHEGQSLSCAPACTYLNDVNHFSVAYFTREDDTNGDHGGAIFEGNTQQLLGCSQTHAFTSDAQSMRCCCVSRDSMAFDPEIMQ